MDELDKVTEKSARGGLHLFMGSFISEILNAIGIIIVARLLSPEEMGAYSLSFVIPGMFVLFTSWGLNEALIRNLALYQNQNRWDDMRRMVKVGFLFQGSLAIVLSLVLFLSADVLASVLLTRPELGTVVRVTSLLVVLQVINTMMSSVLIGIERMDHRAYVIVLQSVIKVVSASALVILGYGVIGAVVGHMLAVSVSTAISILLIYKNMMGKPDTYGEEVREDSSLKELLKFGFPLYLGAFLLNISLRYKGLLLAWFADNTAIGNLDIAVKFISLITLFTFPVQSVMYPTFSKFSFIDQADELKVLFKSSVRYATLLVIPVASLVTVLSEQFVVTLFGNKYQQAPLFLALSLLQFLAVGIGSLSSFTFLNSQGDTLTTLKLNGINVAFSMVLGTIMTWRLGIPGLLLGSFLSTISANTVNLYVINKRYSVRVDIGYSVRVAIFSGISALSAYSVLRLIDTTNTWINLIVGSLSFLLACIPSMTFIGAVEEADIRNIDRVMSGQPMLYPFVAPLFYIVERMIGFKNGLKTM
jgi:O-antigen/teichoic acid export membrane protein